AKNEYDQASLDNHGNSTDDNIENINNALSRDQCSGLDKLFGKDADSLIDRAERAGVAIQDLQGYIVGNEEAMRRVTEATRSYIAEGLDPTATQSEINAARSEEHTSELQSRENLVCRLLLEKKNTPPRTQ